MRKALQALPPACSTAMGLERRAERSYRDGGGSPCLPQPHRSAGCIPAAPQRRCIPPFPPPTPPSFCRKVSFSAASSLPWQPCCSLPSGCDARRGGAELQTPTAVLWVLGSIAHVQPRPCSPVTQPQPHAAPPYPHLQRAEQSFGILAAMGRCCGAGSAWLGVGWGAVGTLLQGCAWLQTPPAAWGGGYSTASRRHLL